MHAEARPYRAKRVSVWWRDEEPRGELDRRMDGSTNRGVGGARLAVAPLGDAREA
jgi:hypothetical protein